MDDNDDTKSSKALLADTRTFLTDNLRYQFPFMRTSLMSEAVEGALTALQQKIEEAKPQMTASKAGSSFFSLPAELRNYIYDLSFKPDDQGSYRVHFDECSDTMERTGCYRAKDSETYKIDFLEDVCIGFPRLLLASRQVRAEAMPIFLSNLTVTGASDRYTPWEEHDAILAAKAWLNALGPKYVKLIKAFVLHAVSAVGRPSNTELWEMFGFRGLGLRKDAVKFDSACRLPQLWR